MQHTTKTGQGEVVITPHLLQKVTVKKKYFGIISLFCGLQSIVLTGFTIHWFQTQIIDKNSMYGLILLALFLFLPCYYLWQAKRLLEDLENYKSQRAFNSYLDMVNRFWRFCGVCAVINCIGIPVLLAMYFFNLL